MYVIGFDTGLVPMVRHCGDTFLTINAARSSNPQLRHPKIGPTSSVMYAGLTVNCPHISDVLILPSDSNQGPSSAWQPFRAKTLPSISPSNDESVLIGAQLPRTSKSLEEPRSSR